MPAIRGSKSPQIIYRDVPARVKTAIGAYWNQKWKRLERLIQPFPPDQRHLRLTVHNDDPTYDVRMVLMLPTGTLVAQGRSLAGDFHDAMDIAADHLAAEIRRHKGLLRQEHLYHRKRRRQGDIAGVEAALQECHAIGDLDTFAELLRRALRGLSEHAHRELIIAQLEGVVQPDELSVSDLLNLVIAQAWKAFDRKPAGEPLEFWLTRLLHEVLDARGLEPPPGKPLDQGFPRDGPRFLAENGWLLKQEPFWDEPEPLTLEQVLANREPPKSWLTAGADEQRRWIFAHLREFPRTARRAFTLYALEGWAPDDIAVLQNRSVKEVLHDVEEVRDTLDRRLSS